MKTWFVTVPIVGIATIRVKADTEEEAIEKGREEVTRDDIEEWEPAEAIGAMYQTVTTAEEA